MHKGFIGLLLLPGCITVTNSDKDSNTTDSGLTTDTNTTDTTDTVPPDPDDDGDGFPASVDCNDADASINPDALELCDTIDNNCTDTIDDEATASVDGANYASMDEAFAAMTDGAQMDLCPGTWTFTSQAVSTGTWTLFGVSGRDTTTISEVGNISGFVVTGDAVLNLTGVTLTGSSAQGSHAVDLSVGGTVNVSASRVTGNWQGLYVHAETTGKTPTLTVDGSDIDTNGSLDVDGGGIDAQKAVVVTVANSNITGNTALHGGGINAVPSAFLPQTITLTATTIDGNTADVGGGFYGYAVGVPMTLTATDTTFSNNAATSLGGGLFLANAPLVGTGVQVVTNTADVAGGGLALTASSVSGALVSGNQAPGGGGVAALFDVDFIGAPYGNDLVGVVVDSNLGDLGAGLWVDDEVAASTDATSAVTLNSATTDAGGAWLDGPLARIVSSGADWGTATVNDNTPNDLSGFEWIGGIQYEGLATFDCTGDGVCL